MTLDPPQHDDDAPSRFLEIGLHALAAADDQFQAVGDGAPFQYLGVVIARPVVAQTFGLYLPIAAPTQTDWLLLSGIGALGFAARRRRASV